MLDPKTYLITFLLLHSIFIAGCSSMAAKKNTGAVDFRHAEFHGEDVEFQKFFLPDDLQGENVGLIQEGDSVTIKLLTAFVCDFSEDNPFPQDVMLWATDLSSGQKPPTPCSNKGYNRSKHYTRGEIVVLANAFERGGDDKIQYSEGNSDIEGARVIYYDDDVRESGQYLNMVNMPIYGPVTYNGNPLFLRLIMMELDNEENSQLSAFISSLADFAGTAYPPASTALEILNGVGSSLLSGDQDDVEFRYDMTFDPPGGEAKVYLPLKVGLYVFMRKEDRSQDYVWDKNLDDETGRLEAGGASFRKESYFVVSIARNEKALAQDSYQTFSELAATTSESQTDFTELKAVAEKMGARFENLAIYDDLRNRATRLTAGNDSARQNAQHVELLKAGICFSIKAMNADAEGSEKSGESQPALTRSQLLRILELAGPQIAGKVDPMDASTATISHWQSTCA